MLMMNQQREQFRPIIDDIGAANGRAFFVGGAVRDELLGLPSKDIDIEVFGIAPTALTELLRRHGTPIKVGKSFGVVKLRVGDDLVDISLPRREKKAGQGHTEFEVEPDPFMDVKEAVLRRDFTINAMMVDAHTGQLFDSVRGRRDLDGKVLRHVGPQFADDPLRVLRGVQFAARFNLRVAPETARLMQSLSSEFNTISRDRLWIEWEKWAAGLFPMSGLEALEASGWLQHFPVLNNMVGVPQTPWWHPEGDVWTHAKLASWEAMRIARRDDLSREDTVILVLAALLHDVGKATHSQIHEDGHVSAHGHAEAGAPLARSFLRQIGAPNHVQDSIALLVKRHMDHSSMENPPSQRQVNRLAQRLAPVTIETWERLVEADASGRASGNHRPGLPTLEVWQQLESKPFEDGKFVPLLLGRDLIDANLLQPGPQMGLLLASAKHAQLDGVINSREEALEWAREQLEQRV